jgi:glycosyltransferase involved in cell wall biosynthesis
MIDKKLKKSVVIATKNRLQDIIKCIESILIQTLLPDEIVIVDSSDTHELNSRIKEFKSGITKIIYVHTKPGVNYQRNIGIEKSSGDIVFFLDDDTILEKDFLKEIVNVFENDKEKKIGGVQGDIINVKTKNRSVVYSILTAISRTINIALDNIFFLYKIGNGKFRLSGFPTYRYGTNKMVYVECLPSGLTAFRREVLNEFAWDENIYYMTDDDFSYRVSRKYKNVYTPYARLIHNVSPTAREKAYLRRKLFIESYCRHFKKNLPQTFKHKFAFYMAITGLFMMEILGMIVPRRNADGLRGLKDGLLEIRGKRWIKL